MKKFVFVVVLVLIGVVSCNKGVSANSLVSTTWVNQDGSGSLSFTDKSQVVITLSGSAIPATYTVVDNTITMTAMADSIIGKIEGNKITITGELLSGEIFSKR